MVISFPANLCAVFEILVMVFQVLRDHGSLPQSTHAAINALVVTRTDRFDHRSLWPWDRRRVVRAPRFGIRPVRRRDHDDPPDRFDDGERHDREDRANASLRDDRARAGGVKRTGSALSLSKRLNSSHRG